MGNEGNDNDRLVFDYLSRIGDLAQQRQVPAAERRELVTGLRDEIERRRTVKGERVPGILGALGTPDEVVGRVAPQTPPAPVPDEAPAAAGTRAADSGVPGARAADWWQDGATDTGAVPGFVGGIEIPELLRPPRPEDDADTDADADAGPERRGEGAGGAGAGGPGDATGRLPSRAVRLRGLRPGSPLLLIAAGLLLVGAALGSLVPLAAGWLLAYASRERRGAALVIPGLTATAGAVWLWGRVQGRWGDPVAPGGEAMGAAVSATWPWTLRAAAVASALFLLWRSRRRV
ncbi:hypothetical protein ACGF1Z_18980 [Streptomyces sp. NPDC048018]|uniref:hypothetical protein n=1 Tax=Streptomyces sp. NPDC048018 TaxID=3365499 RepID=UPI00371884CF